VLKNGSARLGVQVNCPQAAVQPTASLFRQATAGGLRVAIVVGDNHTLHCGVKDGAYILAKTLREAGFHVDVLAPESWGLTSVWKFLRQLRKSRYDILHVEYPSIGYRSSLFPHALGLMGGARATVATLHEFSASPALQQLSTHVFRWSTGTLLFASEYEQSRFNRHLGLLGACQKVFPVVSQVPSVPSSRGRDATVLYFGQIRPKKGLEAYLDLARHSIQAGRQYKFHIMGSISSAHKAYAGSLQAQAPPQVRWSFDLPFEAVGKILGQSFAAYLPFPDGASERRGSLAAAWLNGLPVLSRIGEATTPAILPMLVPVNNVEEALSALDELSGEPNKYERISAASREFALNRTWEGVAMIHAGVYRTLINI
jgi:glycosyltransferase involved in cell wall biosynthesis